MGDSFDKSQEMRAERIKKLREEFGFSKADMARMCGITQTAYTNIENAETKSITIETGKKIANSLKISFFDLFEIDGDSQKIANLNNEIETLKKRIEELEEQLKDKRRIISLIENDDVLSQIALAIKSVIEPFQHRKRDFNDTDSLLKELEEKQPYDRDSRESTKQYILDNLNILKKTRKT